MRLSRLLYTSLDGAYESTRDGFGKGLVEIGKEHEDVLVLCADLPESTRAARFKEVFPERYFDCGVAEQNMAGVAAGLALSGKIPFICSFAVFSPGRNWDQIRVSICYSQANVKIAASHTGLGVGEDGANHQALEDIAITRVLPNMMVFAPADAEETRKITHAMVSLDSPMYIRFGKQQVRTYTTEHTPFAIGKAYIYTEGHDVTLISTGQILEFSLEAARNLEKIGISAEVIHAPTIKPLDVQTLLQSLGKTRCGVTVEDHQLAGGFGSAVLENVSRSLLVPIEMVGMQDSFGESGNYLELFKKYGIYTDTIVEKAKIAIQRKKT